MFASGAWHGVLVLFGKKLNKPLGRFRFSTDCSARNGKLRFGTNVSYRLVCIAYGCFFLVLLCYSDDSKVPTNSFLFVCLLEASQIDKTEPLDIFPRLTRLTEARCVLGLRVLLRSSSLLLQVSQSANRVTDFSFWLLVKLSGPLPPVTH